MKFSRLGAVALVLAVSCGAQSPVLKQGEQVFAKSCATGYCHGVKGGSSGAPRLAGRGFNQTYINNVVTRGIPGTGMASFTAVLSRADLMAVVAYVATLNGIANPDAGSDGRGGNDFLRTHTHRRSRSRRAVVHGRRAWLWTMLHLP